MQSSVLGSRSGTGLARSVRSLASEIAASHPIPPGNTTRTLGLSPGSGPTGGPPWRRAPYELHALRPSCAGRVFGCDRRGDARLHDRGRVGLMLAPLRCPLEPVTS